MLECPSCQFRNRSHDTHCQQCGSNLLVQICPHCGTEVDFHQINCSSCGAQVGKLWWAIVQHPLPSLIGAEGVGMTWGTPVTEVVDDFCQNVDDITTPMPRPNSMESSIAYLDGQKRYQVLDHLTIVSVAGLRQELEGPLLDCQPLNLTKVELLLEEMQILSQTMDFHNPAMVKAYLSQHKAELPEVVYPYLATYIQFPRAIPRLQDAWYYPLENPNGSRAWGLVLEDLSTLPSLLERWQSKNVSVLQRLRWLEEMIELWEALEPWGCSQSLLTLANLRVDRGDTLCLRRLDFQTTMVAQPGSSLANLWRALLNFGQMGDSRASFAHELAILQRELDQRQLKTLPQLHALLTDVIAELQTTAPELWFIPATTLATLNLEQLPVKKQPQQGGRRGRADNSPTAILPEQLVHLEAVALTDVGRARQHNEDYFLINNRLQQMMTPMGQQANCQGLFILCDGMGGHAEGEVASALAAKTLNQYLNQHWHEQLPAESTLREGVHIANQAIYRLNDQQGRMGNSRMGTTLVAACVQDTAVRFTHVGDSRLYCFTQERGLEQLTIDHEVGQRDIRRGVEPEIAYARPDAYQLTQALGPKDNNFVHPEVNLVEFDADALLLLCSDGLTDNDLLEIEANPLLHDLLFGQVDLTSGVKQLIALANRQNGHDNITAVLVRLQVQSQLPLQI
jgi:protein phosphatase